MKKTSYFFTGALLILTIGLVAGQPVSRRGVVPIIFDTDMGPDYDDVGAITLLHAFADEGQATILATIASTNYSKVTQVLSVLNTYFNRPNIPIGVPKGRAVSDKDAQHWSDTLVARYPPFSPVECGCARCRSPLPTAFSQAARP